MERSHLVFNLMLSKLFLLLVEVVVGEVEAVEEAMIWIELLELHFFQCLAIVLMHFKVSMELPMLVMTKWHLLLIILTLLWLCERAASLENCLQLLRIIVQDKGLL